MKHNVDLHTHTTSSDGQYTPSELVNMAKNIGIEYLAVTDHDTVDGVAEAMKSGADCGITIISGVELGAREDKNLHILGYGFDPEGEKLSELCRKLRGGRDERKYRIISFLKEKGVCISLDEVEELAGGDVIARPHFAQVLVKRGFVTDTREAFDRYLDTDEYKRIERFKASAQECITAIKSAGGYAVLAHPYQLKFSDERLESLVLELKGFGLDGLECYYPKHSSEQVNLYLALAKRYNLHITAGSDFHGEAVKPEVTLVSMPLDIEWLCGQK